MALCFIHRAALGNLVPTPKIVLETILSQKCESTVSSNLYILESVPAFYSNYCAVVVLFGFGMPRIKVSKMIADQNCKILF